MPVLPENWVELVTPGLTNIFWNGIGETADVSERQNVYNVLPSQRAFEQHLGIGGMSNNGWNVGASGRVQFDTIQKLWAPEFHHEEFAKGIQIKQTLFEDNLYSDAGLPATITDQPAMLGRNAETQREMAAAEVFNYAEVNSGFTPSGFPIAGPDGSALVATDHERYPGAPSGLDQSNYFEDYDLTSDNLGLMQRAARKWKDNGENPMGVRLNQIIAGVEWADKADLIRLSQLAPGTANNDTNLGRTKLGGGVIIWDWLDDDRWFYADSVLKARLLLWYERTPLGFVSDQPLTTLVGRWRARMRYSRGFIHWAWVAGAIQTP